MKDENLVDVLQGMIWKDNAPVVLSEDDDDEYIAVERSSQSLLRRLLNPKCQNMA